MVTSHHYNRHFLFMTNPTHKLCNGAFNQGCHSLRSLSSFLTVCVPRSQVLTSLFSASKSSPFGFWQHLCCWTQQKTQDEPEDLWCVWTAKRDSLKTEQFLDNHKPSNRNQLSQNSRVSKIFSVTWKQLKSLWPSLVSWKGFSLEKLQRPSWLTGFFFSFALSEAKFL